MDEAFGRRLRILRAERALSLTAAAERIGIDRSTLRDLEGGKRGRMPHDSTLGKIARAYGVPVRDLIQEEQSVPLARAPQDSPQLPLYEEGFADSASAGKALTVAEAGAVEMLQHFCRFLEAALDSDEAITPEKHIFLAYMVRLVASMGLPLMERGEVREMMHPLALWLSELAERLDEAARELGTEEAAGDVIEAAERFRKAG